SLAGGQLREERRPGECIDVLDEVVGIPLDEGRARAAGALVVERRLVLGEASRVPVDVEDACPDAGHRDGDRVGVAHVADADGSPRTVDDREVARVALRTLRTGSARGARRARSTRAPGSARSARAARRTDRAVRAVRSCWSLGAGKLYG